MKIEATELPRLDEIESAIIDIFIRATKILGYPKSIGEIFGLLYISKIPLSMDDIIQRLGISLGAASQGLKLLKSIHAVKTNHVIGQRRDFYTAETNLEELVHRYLKQEFESHLESWKHNQDSILNRLKNREDSVENNRHLEERLGNLENLYKKSATMLNLLTEATNGKNN